MSDEREQDAAEAAYQKITRAIEENLLPELVKTSETLSNLAKRARASDMRGVILSDAWIDGMAATMRHAHRRINEQSSTIDRLTAERDAARAELAKLRSVIWSAYADTHAYLYTANGTPEKVVAAYETLKAAYENIRAALGIESEAGE